MKHQTITIHDKDGALRATITGAESMITLVGLPLAPLLRRRLDDGSQLLQYRVRTVKRKPFTLSMGSVKLGVFKGDRISVEVPADSK